MYFFGNENHLMKYLDFFSLPKRFIQKIGFILINNTEIAIYLLAKYTKWITIPRKSDIQLSLTIL